MDGEGNILQKEQRAVVNIHQTGKKKKTFNTILKYT
jgi:hypothetical protein